VTYKVGDQVSVTSNGAPWALIEVSAAKVYPYFRGDYGYLERPRYSGHVFIAVTIGYVAETDGVTYGPFDWQVFSNNVAFDQAFVVYGPGPELSSGTLPTARAAVGTIVFEVPKTGRVLLSYTGSFLAQSPVFEVVIRPK
jgi:hypothetical protein